MHVDADSFVVTVDACPVRGFASHAGAAHRGEDRGDDLVAEGEQGLLPAALLGQDTAPARTWVRQVLGPLATDTENDERLRETLRVFLHAESSFKAAADLLNLHANSVSTGCIRPQNDVVNPSKMIGSMSRSHS